MKKQMEPEVKIILKYKGEDCPISVQPESSVSELFLRLLELWNIVPDTLKLIFKKSKGYPHDNVITLEDADKTLSSVGLVDGVKLFVVGSSVKELQTIQAIKTNPRVMSFDEEDERGRVRLYDGNTVKHRPSSTPYFGAMESLPNFTVPSPSPSAALELLKDIAYHPGIVSIMRKHNWNVGILAEMPPEGLVGIDKVCTLGYNVNHGQKIYLRLRTDDLMGFRKFEVILKTMLHELSHCDHMDHTDKFWKLFRQLEREVVELDWTKSKGYVLGHGDSSTINSREEYSPFQCTLSIPEPSSVIHPTLSTSEPQNLPSFVSPPVNLGTDISLPNSSIPQELQTIQIKQPSEEQSDKKKDSSTENNCWICKTCTYLNPLNLNHCDICGVSRTPENQSINDITKESSLLTIHQSTSDIERTLQSEIDKLLKTISKQEAGITLKTIRTILGNILHHPTEDKYKKISLTNKVYQNKIAKYPIAHQILLKAGFEEDKQHSQLIFNRKDYGLIWLACSLIDSNEP